MRVFHREFGYRYDSYEFGYATYCQLEAGDALASVYAAGFLPYSADPDTHDLFYMARSVRVPISDFTHTSENRRILKKFDGGFSSRILSKEELASDPDFLPCFLSYFKERHGERVMTEERTRGILATALPLRGVRYEKNGVLAGYVLEIAKDGFAHYWYSCYAPHFAGTSFGMWLMLDAAGRARDEGRAHLYLGTAYGAKGRYKLNFEPIEFWDGAIWDADGKRLKALISALVS